MILKIRLVCLCNRYGLLLLIILFPPLASFIISDSKWAIEVNLPIQTHYDDIYLINPNKTQGLTFQNMTTNQIRQAFLEEEQRNMGIEVKAGDLGGTEDVESIDKDFYACYIRNLSEVYVIVDQYENYPQNMEFAKNLASILDVSSPSYLRRVILVSSRHFEKLTPEDTQNVCFSIYIHKVRAGGSSQKLDVDILYMDDTIPLTFQYQEVFYPNSNSTYQQMSGINSNMESWRKFSIASYTSIQYYLYMAYKQVFDLTVYGRNDTLKYAQQIEFLYVPAMTGEMTYRNLQETSIFIFSFPFVIVLIYFAPFLYLVTEILEDQKSLRLKRLVILGLQQSTNICSWLIITFLISIYYTTTVYFIANKVFFDDRYFFWFIFLYGMTLLPGALFICLIIQMLSIQDFMIFPTVLFMMGTFIKQSMSTECKIDPYSSYQMWAEILFPNIVLREGLLTLALQALRNSEQKITSLCEFPNVDMLVFRSQVGCFFYIIAAFSIDANTPQILKYFQKALNSLKLLVCSRVKPAQRINSPQRMDPDFLLFKLNNEILNKMKQNERESELQKMKDTLFNQINRNIRSKLDKKDDYFKINNLHLERSSQNISCTLYSSQIIVLTGDNGSGKSELINALMGLFDESNLQKLDAFELGKASKEKDQYYSLSGFSLEDDFLFSPLTVKSQIDIFCTLKYPSSGKKQFKKAQIIEICNLTPLLSKATSALSSGEKLRLKIALALLGRNRLMLIDFGSKDLHSDVKNKLIEYLKLKKRNRLIIIIDNKSETIELMGERIVYMKNGEVHCDADSLQLQKYQKMSYYLNIYFKEDAPQHYFNQILETLQSNLKSDAKIDVLSQNQCQYSFSYNPAYEISAFLQQIESDESISDYTLSLKLYQPLLEKIHSLNSENPQSFVSFERHSHLLIDQRDKKNFIVKTFTQLFSIVLSNFREFRNNALPLWSKCLLYSILMITMLSTAFPEKPFYDIEFKYDSPAYYSQLSSIWKNQGTKRFNDSTWVKEIVDLDHANYYQQNNYGLIGKIGKSSRSAKPTSQMPLIDFPRPRISTVIIANNSYNEFSAGMLTELNFANLFASEFNLKSYSIRTCPLSSMCTDDLFSMRQSVQEMKLLLPLLSSFAMFIFLDDMLARHINKQESDQKRQIVNKASRLVYWVAQYVTDLIFTFLPILVSFTFSLLVLQDSLLTQFWKSNFYYLIYFWLILPLFIYVLSLTQSSIVSGTTLIFVLLMGAGVLLEATFSVISNISSKATVDSTDFYILTLHFPFSVINGLIMFNHDAIEFKEQHLGYEFLKKEDVSYYFQHFVKVCLITIFCFEIRLFSLVGRIIYGLNCCRKQEKYYSKVSMNSGLGSSLISKKTLTLDKAPVLQCQNVSLQTFNPLPQSKLTSVSFQIQKGECISIVSGGSSSGLSLLHQCITGRYYLSSGSISLKGKGLTYCNQSYGLSEDLTLAQQIQFETQLIGVVEDMEGKGKVHLLVELLGLKDKMQKRISEMSEGQKKKVGVLMALMGQTEVQCFDDPFQGLDAPSRIALLRIFGKFSSSINHAILFTSNSFEEAELIADKIGILKNGTLVAFDTLQNLQTEYCEYSFEVHIVIRISQELIDQLKFEHDFKRGMKINQNNFKQVTKALKLEYLNKELEGTSNVVSVSLQEMCKSLRNSSSSLSENPPTKLIIIDEFISFCLIEKLGFQFYKELIKEFRDVEVVQHLGGSFRFLVGSRMNGGSQGRVVDLIQRHMITSSIAEYQVGRPSLETIVNGFVKEGTGEGEGRQLLIGDEDN